MKFVRDTSVEAAARPCNRSSSALAVSAVWNGPTLAATVEIIQLLQVEPFPHQPLQARLVEKIVGKLFIGEHGQSGAFRAGG
jgi:hypothetical protein